jgi:hypothetical protein
VTLSRVLRVAAAGLAVLVLGAGAWILAGNAYAARREREAGLVFEAAFGPRAAMAARYEASAKNTEAGKAETLARAVGYDLSLKARGSRGADGRGGFSEKERAAVSGYVTAQLVRPDDSVGAPSPEVATLLDKRRAALTAFEELFASAPPPRWGWDPVVTAGERREPNLLGHIQLQRLLIADALASAAGGKGPAASRALEASWKLNEGLASRPDVISQIMAIAVARYEAGALRRIDASAGDWTPRLTAMGSRARLVEAILLDHPRPADMAARYRSLRPAGVGWWAHNFVSILEEPAGRLADADYRSAWTRAIAELRDGPAFREREPDQKPGWSTTAILMSIVIPNIRLSFDRADRLALDAELTGKILRVEEIRRAQGAWPQPSAEIASSRFPGLSWNYTVGPGAMTIALNRKLPEQKSGLVLPTSFSSQATAP